MWIDIRAHPCNLDNVTRFVRDWKGYYIWKTSKGFVVTLNGKAREGWFPSEQEALEICK